jgi:hypothetical protein
VSPPVAPKKASIGNWLVAIVGGLLLVGYCSSVMNRTTDTPRTTNRPMVASSEPDEPCVVEAPASARQAAQNWCEGGIFTKVNVSNDANNFVVLLQFSNKGYRSWQNAEHTILNRFRRVTDQIAETADMNVAFSLHNTKGDVVGGCARKRSARESICNGR